MFICLFSSQPAVALSIARACSPRVARYGDAVVADVSGCARTIGPPHTIVREVTALAADHDLIIRVAVASTVTTAWLLAHSRSGMTVVALGTESTSLSTLPLRCLETLHALDQPLDFAQGTPPSNPRTLEPWNPGTLEPWNPRTLEPSNPRTSYVEPLTTFERWGLKTVGDVAALPRRDVHTRMGPIGVRLHQAACGEDVRPLVPIETPPPFVEAMTLEWPIDGLEPLAFVLARLCERLSARLERADRGAVVLRTRLRLVTRETHERVLCLPAPIADARVLRTLVLLDLESHPPSAAIDIVSLHLEVMPGRIVQGSLLAAAVPSPEDLATLTARLSALMGETRVGAPVLLDTFDVRVVGMRTFDLIGGHKGIGHRAHEGKGQRAEGRGKGEKGKGLERTGERHLINQNDPNQTKGWPSPEGSTPLPCSPLPLPSAPCPLPFKSPLPLPSPTLRRFRIPLAVRIVADRGVPVRVVTASRGLRGGDVVMRAGPWRTSGGWWTFDRANWDRDEWDVQLSDGGVYRVARHRATGVWEIEGILD